MRPRRVRFLRSTPAWAGEDQASVFLPGSVPGSVGLGAASPVASALLGRLHRRAAVGDVRLVLGLVRLGDEVLLLRVETLGGGSTRRMAWLWTLMSTPGATSTTAGWSRLSGS